VVTAAEAAVERVVQVQLEAYNRRDLDGFMAMLAPEIQLYAFPDTLLHAGHDELRRVYGELFATATELRARVLDRVVQGNYVTDREVTTGMPGKGPLTGVAIYAVRDGRVARIWFLE
jgi:hypothetical protein